MSTTKTKRTKTTKTNPFTEQAPEPKPMSAAEKEAALDRLTAHEEAITALAEKSGALLHRLSRDGLLNDLVNGLWLLLAMNSRVEESYLHHLTPDQRLGLLLTTAVAKLPDDVQVVQPHEEASVAGLIDPLQFDTEAERGWAKAVNDYRRARPPKRLGTPVPDHFKQRFAPDLLPADWPPNSTPSTDVLLNDDDLDEMGEIRHHVPRQQERP